MKTIVEMAAQLRRWADEIEASRVAEIDPVGPGITVTEAVRVIRAATGDEYMTLGMTLTVYNAGNSVVDWSTYVHNSDHNRGHATLKAAVEARLAIISPAGAVESVEATLAGDDRPF